MLPEDFMDEIVRRARSPVGDMALHANGVVHMVWRVVSLDVDGSRRGRQDMAALAEGPYVVVADVRSVGYIDAGARRHWAGEDEHAPLAAAVEVGDAGPLRWVLDRWLKDSPPARPAAIFEHEDEAMRWAGEQAQRLLP